MPSKKHIKVLVVDDHPAFRLGIATLIETQPDMTLVGEAGSGPEAIEVYRRTKPDIVLMDLRLPGMSGVEAIMILQKEFPESKIIVLTTYDTDEDIYRALQAGAKSYLIKDTPKEGIVTMIRDVYAGIQSLPVNIAEKLQKRRERDSLSQREIETLQLLAKGKSNKEIANALGISEATVKTHLQNLFLKLGVHDRVSAVIYAIRHGIVHLE